MDEGSATIDIVIKQGPVGLVCTSQLGPKLVKQTSGSSRRDKAYALSKECSRL